jgi:hypothetical protein
MIKMAFGEDSMSRTQVFEWFCHFKEGRMLVYGNKCPRRPLMCRNSEMIDKMPTLLQSDEGQ